MACWREHISLSEKTLWHSRKDGERESNTSLLLLGSNSYPPHVAEKFYNIYMLHVAEKFECSECRHKLFAMAYLRKHHWWERWKQQSSATGCWKVWQHLAASFWSVPLHHLHQCLHMRQEKGSLVGQSCCSNAWRCLMLDRPRAIVFERPLCPRWSYLSLRPDTGPPPPPYLDPPKLPPLNNNRDPHS